ncbi:17835_t:CDS:2 [Rhizophagus irregularis]|nr:17835_t:CDS:2 [Rhizophagus irregularis]
MECLYDNTQGTLAEEFNLEETIEVIEDVKNNDESNITSGPILGLELEGQEASNYPLLAQPIELSVGTRFSSWIIAEHYLKEYGRQKGFVVNRYRVEYSKSSADPNNRIVKKRTFACENAGRYKPNKTRPIEQQPVASSSSMADVVEALDSRMQKEALNKSFIAWKYNTTVYHQPFVIESFFSKINSEIKKYFSPRIVEEIHKQMCESILYRCERIDIDEAFAFDDDQLYQDDLAKNSMDQMDLDITSEAEIIKNNEDCYDY